MAVPNDLIIQNNDGGAIMADKFNRGLQFVDTAGSTVAGDASAAANSAIQASNAASSAQEIALGVSTGLPDIRPSLLLDFVNNDALDPRINVNRSTSRTYWDAHGVLREAGPNEWPLEFDPLTGKCLGRSVWTGTVNKVTARKHNPTDVSGFGAPSGGATLTVVDDWDELVAAGLHEICTNGKVYKFDNSSGSGNSAIANSGTGNVDAHTASVYVRGSGEFAVSLWGITPLYITAPDVYTRYHATGVPSSSSSRFQINASAGSVIYFILPQLEEGAFVSPVIPGDTLAAVTRGVEAIAIPTGNWLNPYEGTLLIRFAEVSAGSNETIFKLDNGGSALGFDLRRTAGGTFFFAARIGATAVGTVNLTSAVSPVGQLNTFAFSYSGSGAYVSINGIAAVSTGSNPGIAPALSALRIGSSHLNREQFCGPVNYLSYCPKRISSAQLQEITRQ